MTFSFVSLAAYHLISPRDNGTEISQDISEEAVFMIH